jgi:acyl carrier protein
LSRENKNGDKYICAYIVLAKEREFIVSELRESLSKELPDYMVPSYFVPLEQIPLTPNGKIDQRALPKPVFKGGESYAAPRNEIERKLVELWSGVLEIDKELIGIDSNFFELGGHSLNATSLISKIHKKLDEKVPLAEIFRGPSIRKLSAFINNSVKHKFISLEAVEKKEYYPLSSVQKRIYVLQQMDLEGLVYNIPAVMKLEGEVSKEKFEEIFKQLIERNESFRTSFLMLDGQPMQRIHDNVEFEIEYYDLQVTGAGAGCRWEEAPSGQVSDASGEITRTKTETHHSSFIIHHSFIRPFDLAHAPMMRVGLIKTVAQEHILMVDLHHIISDGTSAGIIIKEFMDLLAGTGRKKITCIKIPIQKLFPMAQWAGWQRVHRRAANLLAKAV